MERDPALRELTDEQLLREAEPIARELQTRELGDTTIDEVVEVVENSKDTTANTESLESFVDVNQKRFEFAYTDNLVRMITPEVWTKMFEARNKLFEEARLINDEPKLLQVNKQLEVSDFSPVLLPDEQGAAQIFIAFTRPTGIYVGDLNEADYVRNRFLDSSSISFDMNYDLYSAIVTHINSSKVSPETEMSEIDTPHNGLHTNTLLYGDQVVVEDGALLVRAQVVNHHANILAPSVIDYNKEKSSPNSKFEDRLRPFVEVI